MTRNSTTRAFREYAVSLITAEKGVEEVAAELKIEVAKLKRWQEKMNAPYTPNSRTEVPHPSQEITNKDNATEVPIENMKEKQLENENRHLKELLRLATSWISLQLSAQKEHEV